MKARFLALARAVPFACAVAVAVLGIESLAKPGVVDAAGPLPACRYDDYLTTPRGYEDWRVTLVDTILRVGTGYTPPDLVPVSVAGIAGSGQVREVVIDDLREMAEAAEAAGNGIAVHSAYRSYATQKQVFESWVDRFGYDRALELSARPGHSEHQLGLGIDFRSEPGGSPFNGDWGTTPAGRWMKAHAWKHGFILSYPKGAMKTVCYDYEPWHYRYVGRNLAAAIHESGLTVREYLWSHFTETIVRPPTPKPGTIPKPTATPALTATPAPTAHSTPTPSPTPRPSSTSADTAAPPSTGSSPAASAPAGDPQSTGVLEPGILAGLALAIGTIVLGGVLMARRGRSGVGL
jgi:D-alanyl-D-alanine carboxypeptidase